MKVVLLKNVDNLGKFGDIKEVAQGYGRNYLIPLGLAALAQPETLARITMIQKKEEKRKVEEKKSFEKLAEELQGKTFEISSKASSEGNLYGGVSAQNISLLLQSHKFTVDASRIKADHIKALGEHTVKITLPHGKFVEITLTVKEEKK